jgi:hypothetical protein
MPSSQREAEMIDEALNDESKSVDEIVLHDPDGLSLGDRTAQRHRETLNELMKPTPAKPATTKRALPRKRDSTKFDCCDHQLMWRFWVRNDHSAKTTVQCNCRVVIPIDQRIHCVHASLLCSAQKLDLEALPVTVALMPGSYCEQCRVPGLAFGTPCNQRNERVIVPQSERFETIATQIDRSSSSTGGLQPAPLPVRSQSVASR